MERYKVPLTTAQEYGWSSRQLMTQGPLFNRPKQQCDVTVYADAYYEMMGMSPYANKQAVEAKKGG